MWLQLLHNHGLSACQQFWGSRVPMGDTPMCALGDPERALNPSPHTLSRSAVLLAQRPSGRLSCLYPWRSQKGTLVGSSSSSHSQGLVQPAQAPGRRHACPWLQGQVADFSLGCGTWNNQVPGPDLPTQEPIQWWGSQGPGGSYTCCTSGNRPTVWGHNCRPWSGYLFQHHFTEQGTWGSLILKYIM